MMYVSFMNWRCSFATFFSMSIHGSSWHVGICQLEDTFFSGNIAKSCPEKIVLGVFATFRFQTFDCYMRFRVVKWCIKDMYAI